VNCSTNNEMTASSLNKGENVNFSGEVDELYLNVCGLEDVLSKSNNEI